MQSYYDSLRFQDHNVDFSDFQIVFLQLVSQVISQLIGKLSFKQKCCSVFSHIELFLLNFALKPICSFYMITKYIQFILLIIVMLCISCANDEYDFKTSDDAINTYRNYYSNICSIKSSNTNSFISELNKWHEINDTVWRFISKQPESYHNQEIWNNFADIHDSVRHQMLQLSETWRYGYRDVLAIKEQTSPFLDDKELHSAVSEAEPFFLSLDSIPVIPVEMPNFIIQYKQFLTEQKNRKFSSKEDIEMFIRREDRYFRSFLSQMHDMQGQQLGEITHNTENVCRNIFIAAREGRISARDAVVYMSMRTTRRLLQNSVLCLKDIDRQEISDISESNAYLWMIIQPFISIDKLSIATLTPQEKSDFNYVVSQLPKSQNFAKLFKIEQQTLNYLLPQQLLKLYIMSF